MRLITGILLLIPVLLISACSTTATRIADPLENEQYVRRVESFKTLASWNLDARLAVSNDEDGGSGKLRWDHAPNADRLDFHGALGRGAWQIRADEGSAQLTRADGTVTKATDINQLVEQQMGRALPVDSLAWWVLGMAAPGPLEEIELDSDGLPRRIVQQGWEIEFDGYRARGDQLIPGRVEARQDDWKVKLAVRKWQARPATP